MAQSAPTHCEKSPINKRISQWINHVVPVEREKSAVYPRWNPRMDHFQLVPHLLFSHRQFHGRCRHARVFPSGPERTNALTKAPSSGYVTMDQSRSSSGTRELSWFAWNCFCDGWLTSFVLVGVDWQRRRMVQSVSPRVHNPQSHYTG